MAIPRRSSKAPQGRCCHSFCALAAARPARGRRCWISGRDAQEILDEVASAMAHWRGHARLAGVSARTVTAIEKAIKECLARL